LLANGAGSHHRQGLIETQNGLTELIERGLVRSREHRHPVLSEARVGTERVDTHALHVEQAASNDQERVVGQLFSPDSEATAHDDPGLKTLSMRTPACLCCLVTVWVYVFSVTPMSAWPRRSCITLSSDHDPADRLRGVAQALGRDPRHASFDDERIHEPAEVARVDPTAQHRGEHQT
jgi:hypothetical protein